MTPLRRTPLITKKGLARGNKRLETKKPLPGPSKGIKKRSKKMQTLYEEERIPFVKEFLAENPICQVQWDRCCQQQARDVHEVLPRGRGGKIVKGKNQFKAVCGYCHYIITHVHVGEARERGFIV